MFQLNLEAGRSVNKSVKMSENITILNELKEVAPALLQAEKNALYSVPENYFHNLPDRIMDAVAASYLPKPVNVYQVPDGYFKSLSLEILKRVGNYGLASTELPYTVPSGYFETFSSTVLSAISNNTENESRNEIKEELLSIAPSLASIGNKNVYSVPDGYFENIPVTGNLKKTAAKIISLGTRIRRSITYAAAASVFGLISISSITYVKNHNRYNGAMPELHEKFADISDDEIQNYLDGGNTHILQNGDGQSEELQDFFKNASDEDIQNYLEDNADLDDTENSGI